ncbi:hypothetical protein PLICRDRAFT_98672 [Plicaturopsis crispa FD-325 SS-3]|nr:hypothetical protein PLICRDRAFT_98672 [Plicaturopsis crispa FD-325 SS-3]
MPPSVSTNPSYADLHITSHASNWLWAVFAVMALSTLIASAWQFTRPVGQRLFHQLPVIILTVASLAYFSMASNLGRTPIYVEYTHGREGNITRDIFYVRYIQWFINAPLILLELLLVSGVSYSDIFSTMFMAFVLVVSGLVGALVNTSYKWGFFAFGLFALAYIMYTLVGYAPRTNFYAGGTLRRTFHASAVYLTIVFAIYPLAWALCEGSNEIGPTGEMVWYGILDLLAGPVFLFFFLFRTRRIDYNSYGLGNRTGAYAGAEGADAGLGANAGRHGGNEKGGRFSFGRTSNSTNYTGSTHEPINGPAHLTGGNAAPLGVGPNTGATGMHSNTANVV